MTTHNALLTHTELRVLVVEDDADFAALVGEHLAGQPEVEIDVATVGTLEDARLRLSGDEFDAVLPDVRLPDSAGSRTVREIITVTPNTAVIVLTALADQELPHRSGGTLRSDLRSLTSVLGYLVSFNRARALGNRPTPSEARRFADGDQDVTADLQAPGPGNGTST